MKTQSPTRIVLILIGALVLTGCALKPKQRTSRFHQATQSGNCNCYTCQNSTGNVAASNVVMHSQPATGTWVESSEVVSSSIGSTESFSSTPFSEQPRQPYQVPNEPAAPIVSSEPFTTSSPSIAEEQPLIQEVQPGFKSSGFELSDVDEDSSVGGGSFKPLEGEDIVTAPKVEEPVVDASKPIMVEPLNNKVESLETAKTLKTTEPLKAVETLKPAEPTPAVKLPSADEVAPGPIEIAKPTKVTKPIEIPKPVEVTKTIEIPKPAVEIPTPVEIPEKISIPKKIEVPAPASTFKPGETFKPRKKVKPLETSWLGGGSLDQTQFENSPSDQLVALPPAPVENNESIDTFFGRQSTDAKPLPHPNANGKVVLRANPVERNVVYCPPSQHASKVVVPALQAGFKKQNTAGNWLRNVASERPVAARTASAAPCNDGTCQDSVQEENSREMVAVAARPEPVPPAVLATPPVVESNEPRRLAVKLRAIPMNDQMIRGKRVDVRFREHQPTQRESLKVIDENPAPQQQVIAQPLVEPIVAPIATLNPPANMLEIDLPVESSVALPVVDRTARSSDAVHETATPPWRLK